MNNQKGKSLLLRIDSSFIHHSLFDEILQRLYPTAHTIIIYVMYANHVRFPLYRSPNIFIFTILLKQLVCSSENVISACLFYDKSIL